MFEYAPLTTPAAFRLIRLSSQYTAQNDGVSFDLIESDTDVAPEYTALSYQWGRDDRTHAIFLNGEHFPLHENLWCFLKQLTLDKDDGMYWVDAISINQDDPLERAEQVSRMANIFTSAHQVTIWLGPLPHTEFNLAILLHDRPIESVLSKGLGISKILTQVNALNEILNLEYWRRAWVLPELVLGKHSRLKCLSTHLSLTAFSEKVKHYMSDYNNLIYTEEQLSSWTRSSFIWSESIIKSVSILAAVADLVSGAQAFHLESWLPIVQMQGCKDPRDRVYSLLGLLRLTAQDSSTAPSIPVDYSKPVGLVYWDTIFALLLSGPRSDKLNHRFIEEIARLIIYTSEQPPGHGSNTLSSELTYLSCPLFFMSLSEYVSHYATGSEMLVLAETVLLQTFLLAASFNYRHFYESIGTVVADHSTTRVQSHDAIAVYLGQNIALHYEPYAAALFGREIQKGAYTWHCKECRQPMDDIYDYHDPNTETHESTLAIGDCNSCSEYRSRIYTAMLDFAERKTLGKFEYQLRNTFQSTPSGPEIALEYQKSNDVAILTIFGQKGIPSYDEVLCLRAPPNFYRRADSWSTRNSYGREYQVPVPPYMVFAVQWKLFASGKAVSSVEAGESVLRVPWLRLLKHVRRVNSWDRPSPSENSGNERATHDVEEILIKTSQVNSAGEGLDHHTIPPPPPPPPPPPLPPSQTGKIKPETPKDQRNS